VRQTRYTTAAERGLVAKEDHRKVLGEQEDGLMGLSGVVGVNQGECSETPCIRVLVVKKTTDLLRQIPSAIEGYAVDITETGEIKALDDS
jgi:hypothetical protein